MEVWIFFGMIIAGVVAYSIIGDKVNYEKRAIADAATAKKVKQENKNLELHNKKEELYEKTALINNLVKKADKSIQNEAKNKGNKKARAWFGALYAETQSLLDDYRSNLLRYKKRPSLKGAEQVREVKKEKRELNKKLKIIEYQLKTYEQYFPIIEDFKDYILEDDTFLIKSDGSVSQDEDYDPVQKFLKPEEFKKLPIDRKNQLALDRYLNKTHTKLEIGRFYERYIGYLYEQEDWIVKFFGIIEGFDDLGRDLVCKKGNEIHIVQTKNWSKYKIIREKYLYQHFATTIHYQLQEKISKKVKVKPIFYATIDFSDMAKKVSKALNIQIKTEKLKKDYPMIKCNINPSTKEKIYHLPFDQQYDKVIIGNNPGELYVKTVAEATKKGFRRAFRYRGPA
jgi:hypothetical protein